jgi:Fe-S oxidoreductase
VAPFRPNGKPLHVHGFLMAFQRVAGRNAAMLRDLAARGVPLVGVDPSMTLTYRSEYAKALGRDAAPPVQLIQEWLAGKVAALRIQGVRAAGGGFGLLAHCTEKTVAVPSIRDWQTVFAGLGCSLEPVAVGCCGMAGTYGHEAANAEMSRRIYGLSWSRIVGDPARRDRLVATGYSCRSQVKRIDGRPIPHPVQALLDLLPPVAAE